MKNQKQQPVLDDNQFRALIHLLDDDDPEVSRHVWGKLTEMGTQAVQRLEAEWENLQDRDLQSVVEYAIQRLQTQAAMDDLMDWRDADTPDLLRGWFLVSKYLYPELDFRTFNNEVKRLVNKVWLEMNPQMLPKEQIRAINHILFRMEGYGPNQSRPHHPQNNFLNFVVEQQQGNVMTLSMLYLIICRELQLPVSGILLPGYFVLQYKNHRTEIFIDVFNGGKTFNRSRLEAYLKQVNVPQHSQLIEPASDTLILMNLLNVMHTNYKQADKDEKADEIKKLMEKLDIRTV